MGPLGGEEPGRIARRAQSGLREGLAAMAAWAFRETNQSVYNGLTTEPIILHRSPAKKSGKKIFGELG